VTALPWLVAHARRVVRTARRSVAWAFGYNAVAVGLAATGNLTPMVATVAMLASSLVVVANARRLAGATASDVRDATTAPALSRAA
jgi:cation transport ATPase